MVNVLYASNNCLILPCKTICEMTIKTNIEEVRNQLMDSVKLVAVSKTHSSELIQEVYNEGLRDFAENKVQELVGKQAKLPSDIQWHFIGHLQTNKVKYIVPFVHLIHSVDSLKLLQAIDKEAIKNQCVVNCLLQIHIAKEDTKFGFSEEELINMLTTLELEQLTHVRICGLMGMATFTNDENIVHQEFAQLASIYKKVKETYFKENIDFTELSMGMSDDYLIAMKEGSTMVRIGSIIFGERDYSK